MHSTARYIATAVKRGTPLLMGFIADQSPRKKDAQHYLPFLNHSAPVLTGPEKITGHFHLHPLFLSINRVKRGYYECALIPLHDDTTPTPPPADKTLLPALGTRNPGSPNSTCGRTNDSDTHNPLTPNISLSYVDIDFVITWVDMNDPSWQAEYARYAQGRQNAKNGTSAARFRDNGLLRYWFRGVEKFAPGYAKSTSSPADKNPGG